MNYVACIAEGAAEIAVPVLQKKRQMIPLGEYVESDWKLNQITVIPQHGKFRISVILEDGKAFKPTISAFSH